MDSRERLAGVFADAFASPDGYGKLSVAGALSKWGDQIDFILTSDWLRETLAAERRAGFIAGRDAAAQKVADEDVRLRGNLSGGGLHTAIRNLEPEATDAG